MVLSLLCVVAMSLPGGPMTAEEAALLKACGVSEPEIIAAAQRLGEMECDADDVKLLREAGLSEAAIDRISVTEPVLRRLRRLAATFTPVSACEGALRLLSPEGFVVRDDRLDADSWVWRAEDPPTVRAVEKRVVFALYRRDTGLSRAAAGAATSAALDVFLDRTEAAAGRPRLLERGMIDLGGAPAPFFRIAAESDGVVFEAGFALRVESDGAVFGVGYLAPAATAESFRPRFADFAAYASRRDG